MRFKSHGLIYLSNATLGPYELSHVKTGGGTPHMKGVGMLV